MTISDILLPVDVTPQNAPRMKAALALASRFNAHLSGLYVIPKVDIPAYASVNIPQDILDSQQRYQQDLAQESKAAFEEAVKKAKELGLTVSCDLNYRSKLWKWGKAPEEVMSELMKYVDVLIGNEEDAEKIFGIKAPGVDVTKGKVKAE